MTGLLIFGVIIVMLLLILFFGDRRARLDRKERQELVDARATIAKVEQTARESYELSPPLSNVIIDIISEFHTTRNRRELGK